VIKNDAIVDSQVALLKEREQRPAPLSDKAVLNRRNRAMKYFAEKYKDKADVGVFKKFTWAADDVKPAVTVEEHMEICRKNQIEEEKVWEEKLKRGEKPDCEAFRKFLAKKGLSPG
jgi:hypothetical protein